MSICDSCGGTNAAAARFCATCGLPLTALPAEPLEVRKTVTVLFCDVVGSTVLGEATDPETTRRVMARYAQAMTEVVAAYGGTVERFRGDEVMAVFGVPVVHEDDALRAVRAGMEMQRQLAVLNEELRTTWGVELACRIGINTGEVVAGDPGTGDTFVTGDAVNLGKRLEQAAAPGEILIGTATYPLVKDAVRVGPRERFSAKGKRGPVERFRLDDVDATAAGYARRMDMPLVGRERELERLGPTVRDALTENRCTIVSIVGPAGIGKSRLAGELAGMVEATARTVTGRCLPYGSGITYWPLVEIVRDLGGIEAVVDELAGLDDAAIVADRLRASLGKSSDGSASDEIFWGVRRTFEALAARRPLLVCLEDLHWAEPTMLDLVEYLAAFATRPMVLLCTARSDLVDSRPGWSRYPTFELEQLSATETEKLVGAYGIELGALRTQIAATAEGNPLFAEQLAAMVAESPPAAGRPLVLPASIHALLAARLDGLEPDERRALERAAVIGKEFWLRAVADLSAEPDRRRITGLLLALVRKGLVDPAAAAGSGDDSYRFRHALIRDVAYGAIPKAVRADLHEGFAAWLRANADRGFGEHDEIVGYHLEQAFRCREEIAPASGRTRELASAAAELLAASGRRAFARDDMPAAANLLERALALVPPEGRGELELELSGALWSIGERERAEVLLESVLAAATAAADQRVRWHALLERAARSELAHESSVTELYDVAHRAQAVFEELGDDVGLAHAWRRMAVANRLRGAFGAAVVASERALVHAGRAPDAREEGRILDALCTALLYGPTPALEAVERCEQLLEETRGQPSLVAAVCSSLAGLVAMQSRLDEAREVYARAMALWEELGLRFAMAGLTQVGGEIELLAEDPVAAERELRIGAEILASVGGSPFSSALLGKALARQGRLEEADALAREAAERAGHRILAVVVADVVRATVASARGDHDAALAHADRATRRAREADAPNLQAETLEALATCLRAAGRERDAGTALDEALGLYAAKGNLTAGQRLARATL